MRKLQEESFGSGSPIRAIISAAALILLLSFVDVAVAQPRHEPLTVISGRIAGGDGKPMPKAFAALSRGYTWTKTIAVAEAATDGSFRLTTDKRGLFFLVFNGLNHLSETVVLDIDKPKNIRIDVRLSVPEYQPDLSVARVERNTAFKKQSDGTYRLDLPAQGNEYPYVIGRVFKVRGAISGTDAGEIRLHPTGLLMQRIAVPVNGKVTIILDPAKLPKPSGPPEVRFRNPGSSDARLYSIYREMVARTSMAFDAKPRIATDDEISRFLSRVESERDPTLQKVLWLSYLDLTVWGGKPDPPTIQRALDSVTPTSQLWVFTPGLADASVAGAKDAKKYSDYLATVASVMPGDDRVGKPVPAFSAPSFSNAGVVFTNANIKAKLYLIDFWATWCRPCEAQLPYLRRAYDKYRSQGFEILSYSVDTNRELVTSFQKKQPMPWLNAIDPKLAALNSEMAKQFRIGDLPAEFLVDGSGKILATTFDLQGDDLDKAIMVALKNLASAQNREHQMK